MNTRPSNQFIVMNPCCLIRRTLAALLVLMMIQMTVLAAHDPECSGCDPWNCTAGSVTHAGTLSQTSEAICFGTAPTVPTISGTTISNGSKSRTCYNTDCSTYTDGPHEFSYTTSIWWEPEIPSSYTNCGTFTYTAKVKGLSGDSDCPDSTDTVTIGTYTVKVIRLAITPSSTNAVINRCQDPNRKVTFSLTGDSCGSVTWTIEPTVTDGATISGGVVTLGKVAGNYTIKAISTDNTNCSASASLSVTKDCVCTNHVAGGISDQAPGAAGSSCGGTPWTGAVTNFPCGDSVQVLCGPCSNANPNITGGNCVRFFLNGNDVGHCLYGGSSWSSYYFLCKCGDVVKKTVWSITETAPIGPCVGCGYTLTVSCGVRNGPNCFDAVGAARVCNVGGWDY